MLLKLCVFSLIVYFCSATSADPTKSYDILYNEAIEAYLDENWDQCVARMNEAIEDFHFYKDAVVGCRIECMRARSEKDLISPQLEDMKLWERMIKQTLCILKCKKRILRDRAEIVDKTVMESFDILKPYDYLQLCYFKVLITSAICLKLNLQFMHYCRSMISLELPLVPIPFSL